MPYFRIESASAHRITDLPLEILSRIILRVHYSVGIAKVVKLRQVSVTFKSAVEAFQADCIDCSSLQIAAVCRTLPSLQYLEVLKDDGPIDFGHLAKCSRLSHLVVINIPNFDINALQNLPSITEIQVESIKPQFTAPLTNLTFLHWHMRDDSPPDNFEEYKALLQHIPNMKVKYYNFHCSMNNGVQTLCASCCSNSVHTLHIREFGAIFTFHTAYNNFNIAWNHSFCRNNIRAVLSIIKNVDLDLQSSACNGFCSITKLAYNGKSGRHECYLESSQQCLHINQCVLCRSFTAAQWVFCKEIF